MPKVRNKAVKVDFSGVESGGRSVPDGRYVGKVHKVEMRESDKSGADYLAWQLKVLRPRATGSIVYVNTSLQPQALFNLKGMLEAMGQEVPDGEMELSLGEYMDEEVGFEITNEEFRNKMRPQVTGWFPPDELEEGDEEEEEKPAKAKAKVEDDEEEEEKPAKGKTSKFKKGMRVQFEDEDGRTKRGVILKLDETEATVDVKGEEWDVALKELEVVEG